MELFDYMIIGTGLLLIVMGWLCYRFPNIINPYGGMSPERKALVDIKGLKKSVAITFYVAGGLLIVTALLSALKVIGLKMSVYAMTVIVLAMLVPLFVAMKKYNSFGRDKTGKGVYGPRLETAPKIVLVILALSVALVVILIAFTIRPLKIEVGEESVSISGHVRKEHPFQRNRFRGTDRPTAAHRHAHQRGKHSEPSQRPLPTRKRREVYAVCGYQGAAFHRDAHHREPLFSERHRRGSHLDAFLYHKREGGRRIMAKEKENSTNTKTFLLRVDAETMEAVEKWAADEFRSVNGQLQWIIAEALKKSGRKKK